MEAGLLPAGGGGGAACVSAAAPAEAPGTPAGSESSATLPAPACSASFLRSHSWYAGSSASCSFVGSMPRVVCVRASVCGPTRGSKARDARPACCA